MSRESLKSCDCSVCCCTTGAS